MNSNYLKHKLKNRELTFGSWITFSNEASTEILAQAGFDWLVIDMEHAPLGVAEAARLIRIIDLAGIAALCRLPSNDPILAKNVLDAGASGIIVPSIESADEAKRAVDAAYYPPEGKRGVGLGRTHAYGSQFEAYRSRIKNDLIVIAMIETALGVENAEAIARTDGVDALLIGPYDLSGSLGKIGQLHHRDLDFAIKKVLNAALRAGIGCGMHVVHPSEETIRKALAEGFSFLAIGCDMILLDQSARETLGMARKIINKKEKKNDDI